MSGLRLVTGPAQDPVSLEEAKTHLRVEHTADDFKIQTLIPAATMMAEQFTNRRFVTQTWDWTMDSFPPSMSGIDQPLLVPFGNLQSVSSVVVVGSDAVATEISGSPTQINVDTISDPGRITLPSGGSWPALATGSNGVTVRFTTGYGLSAAVPRDIKIAVLLYIEALYDKDERMMALLIKAAESILLQRRLYHIST